MVNRSLVHSFCIISNMISIPIISIFDVRNDSSAHDYRKYQVPELNWYEACLTLFKRSFDLMKCKTCFGIYIKMPCSGHLVHLWNIATPESTASLYQLFLSRMYISKFHTGIWRFSLAFLFVANLTLWKRITFFSTGYSKGIDIREPED